MTETAPPEKGQNHNALSAGKRGRGLLKGRLKATIYRKKGGGGEETKQKSPSQFRAGKARRFSHPLVKKGGFG